MRYITVEVFDPTDNQGWRGGGHMDCIILEDTPQNRLSLTAVNTAILPLMVKGFQTRLAVLEVIETIPLTGVLD